MAHGRLPAVTVSPSCYGHLLCFSNKASRIYTDQFVAIRLYRALYRKPDASWLGDVVDSDQLRTKQGEEKEGEAGGEAASLTEYMNG